MRMPVVAIVGRPNVGKSTIFNRLVGKKIAIIEDIPGVTRDRLYGDVTYGEYKFHLIDTGGIDIGNEKFNKEIIVQAEIAVEEADVVLFVVDGKEGLTANDMEVSKILRKRPKKVVVVVNKMDNTKMTDNIYDFYQLGFDSYMPISGEHNIGIRDLLDEITTNFPVINEEEYSEDTIKFCLIGRPNVGKSSLTNAIINEDRVIVSNIAGTTRDSVDIKFNYDKKEYVVIDTAGIRKKGRVFESIEKYSIIRALRAIERSNVCLVVINAEEGIMEHDKHIAGYALEAGKAVVFVVNKWDTVKDMTTAEYTKKMRSEFQFLTYVPIVYTSALTKKRIHTLMPEIIKVYENSKREIKTSVLNDVIEEAYDLNPAPSYKGKRLKIYFTNQEGTQPPKFVFHVNNKGLVHFSYERYLENKLRENFDLEGTPIILKFKNRSE